MRKGLSEVVKTYVVEVQQDLKYSSLLYYMLKPPYLITQGFKENKNTQEDFSRICVFLVHGKSGGVVEEPPVNILMLIPENINNVCAIQPFWNTLHVT